MFFRHVDKATQTQRDTWDVQTNLFNQCFHAVFSKSLFSTKSLNDSFQIILADVVIFIEIWQRK